jgi:hypothetical protein
MEPKQMSMGLAMMSAMLSEKMTHWSKPSSCMKNLDSSPT